MEDIKESSVGGSWKGMSDAAKAIALAALVLSLFLCVEIIKEWKSIAYVGRDVPITNTIQVNGKGEVFQAPDIATFTFTVQDEQMVVSKAQDNVTKDMTAILAFLKKSGVEDKDIKTTNYNIYPRYEYPSRSIYPPYPDGKQTLAGYDVTQSVTVKVRKLADAGTIVSGVGSLGATEISGLSFTVDKEDTVINQARQKAIVDAKQKAQELASELGVTLVRITSFSDSGNYPMPMYYAKTMGMGGATADSAAAAPLPTGENQFVSNVTITYEIR